MYEFLFQDISFMMLILFLNFFSSMNPMLLIMNFSIFIIIYMMNFFINMNEKWIIIVLLIFLVGGMMIFISMISSIFKYNKNFKYNMFLSVMLSILYIFIIFMNSMNLNINNKMNLMLYNNSIILYMTLLIILMVLIIKDMIFKKQKNMKM